MRAAALTRILLSLTVGWLETLLTRSSARVRRCLVSSSTSTFSSLFLSSWALTLYIWLNLIINNRALCHFRDTLSLHCN